MRGTNRSATAAALAALALMVGCGAVHGATDAGDDIDGGGGGGDGGGGTPDAAPPMGPIQVTVYDRYGSPQPGALVFYHTDDGALIATETTGDDGLAVHDAPPMTTVTIARTDPGEMVTFHRLETIVGAMPNDDIAIGPRVPEPVFRYLGDLDIDFTSGYSGYTTFEARIGCDGYNFYGLGPQSTQIYADECNLGQIPADLLVTVRDAAYNPIAWAIAYGIELDGNAVAIPSWSPNFTRLDINLTNGPDNLVGAEVDVAVIHNGLDYDLGGPGAVSLTPGDSTTLGVLFPPGFASTLQPGLTAMFSSTGDPSAIDGLGLIAGVLAPTAATFDLDIAAELPPPVHDVQLSMLPGPTAVDFVIEGDVEPNTTAIAAGAAWQQNIGSTSTVEWHWNVVANPQVGPPISLPDLPANALTDPNTGDDAWPPPAGAVRVELAAGVLVTPAPWQAFRQNHPTDFFETPLRPDAPVGSRIKMSVGGKFQF